MHFCHAQEIWRDYPQLVPGVLFTQGITPRVSVGRYAEEFTAIARSRVLAHAEGALPEVRAWRGVFSQMGLKPTQYRCASESLLRRYKKEGSLAHLHPLVDLSNAVSMAFAIPLAVFDMARITDYLEVRYATGEELYETFSGQVEHPQPQEVIFADAAGRAHARRWTHRQSGYSAVREETEAVLVVAEAMHASAQADIERLMGAMTAAVESVWSTKATMQILNHVCSRFQM
jgi:DNA/RNA-binding domain of Phe-tRNA-synthetase-like protein